MSGIIGFDSCQCGKMCIRDRNDTEALDYNGWHIGALGGTDIGACAYQGEYQLSLIHISLHVSSAPNVHSKDIGKLAKGDQIVNASSEPGDWICSVSYTHLIHCSQALQYHSMESHD